jgi:thioesterase domain-containing protein
VPETARQYFMDIQRHYPEGPISLAAVSLGSYIAFDLAQQLLAAGRDVHMLALFDAEGPGGRSKIGGKARILAHVRRARAEGPSYALRLVENRLSDLRSRVEKLRVRLAARKGEAKALTIGTFVAANELAVQAYEAQPIDLALTIFRAKGDVFDSPESAADGLGWAPVAEAGFGVIDVPGDHLSILQPPNVAALAAHMARIMARARKA